MLDLELVKKLQNVHLGSQLELYMSKKISENNFDIFLSDLIDDTYWNLSTNIKSKTKEEFLKDWDKIKDIFKSYNRVPVAYFTPVSPLYNERDTIGLTPLYTDSWLILDKLDNYPDYKSKIPLTILEVNTNNIDEFIEGVVIGFSSDDPNDPYQGLSDSYKIALKQSISNNGNYKIKHYLAKYDDKVVGTATVNYDNEIACVYNVTTNREYKNNGICKEIMSYMIKDLTNKGIKIVCLQTEKGFYTEQVYLKLGFKKIFDATAYGVEQ